MLVKNKETDEILTIYDMPDEELISYISSHIEEFWTDYNWLIIHKNFCGTFFDYSYFKEGTIYNIDYENFEKLYEVLEE